MKKIIESMTSALAVYFPYLFNGSIEAVMFSASLQPMVQLAIETILVDICKKGVTRREALRLGISYNSAATQANENIDKGLPLRQDNLFVCSDTNYSEASDIIEATLNNVIHDTEYKKTEFYGYFIGNLAFCPNVDYSNSIYFKNLIEQLTFTQLSVMRYIQTMGKLDFSNCNNYIQENADLKCMEVYFGFKELNRFNLLKREPPFNLGKELDRHSLNTNGELLSKMLSLDKMKDEDLCDIKNACDRMGICTIQDTDQSTLGFGASNK